VSANLDRAETSETAASQLVETGYDNQETFLTWHVADVSFEKEVLDLREPVFHNQENPFLLTWHIPEVYIDHRISS
jgi:hypothetical protein